MYICQCVSCILWFMTSMSRSNIYKIGKIHVLCKISLIAVNHFQIITTCECFMLISFSLTLTLSQGHVSKVMEFMKLVICLLVSIARMTQSVSTVRDILLGYCSWSFCMTLIFVFWDMWACKHCFFEVWGLWPLVFLFLYQLTALYQITALHTLH